MAGRIFSLLSLFVCVCAAGVGARAQTQDPCDLKLPRDSVYYADIRPTPEGKWTLTYTPDIRQVNDASVPVVVRGLLGITGGPKVRGGKIQCAELENRSARPVKAAQLRWVMTARDGDGTVLARGVLPRLEAEVAPGGRLKVVLQDAQFADFLQPLASEGAVVGDYRLDLGVARVEYADGTAEDYAGHAGQPSAAAAARP